jgi:cytochrome c oxidase subunit 2
VPSTGSMKDFRRPGDVPRARGARGVGVGRRGLAALAKLTFATFAVLVILGACAEPPRRTGVERPARVDRLAAGSGAASVAAPADHAQPPRGAPAIIKITARQWAFSPEEIHVAVGQPVILEVTSQDVAHGFSLTSLGVHVDVNPGQTVRIPLQPAQVGVFPFHCHIFCGEGHDEMSGQLVVDP